MAQKLKILPYPPVFPQVCFVLLSLERPFDVEQHVRSKVAGAVAGTSLGMRVNLTEISLPHFATNLINVMHSDVILIILSGT